MKSENRMFAPYSTISTIATRMLRSSTPAAEVFVAVSTNSAGIAKAIVTRKSDEPLASAAVLLNVCDFLPFPPRSMARPRTSRRLPMIEPVSEAFTTSGKPARSARNQMISSVAFPNVELSSPPAAGEVRDASSSTESPMYFARGMTAPAERKKRISGETPSRLDTIATGTNTSKTRNTLSIAMREGYHARQSGDSR